MSDQTGGTSENRETEASAESRDSHPSSVTYPATLIVRHLCILLALCGVLFFWNLGALGLTDRDEGRNAEAGREMLETGDWISPTFNYEPRYAKPALVYWLMSASYKTFGVSAFAARFPSALFGLGLVLMLYLFLARLRDPVTALLAALMLALNLQMIALNRMALTDSVLIFFTTLSLFAFWLGFQTTHARRHWLWICYLAMGLGTLAKGPVGFLVPLITIALYLSLTKQWGRFWQEGKPLPGTALTVLIALPWYATMWWLHGAEYAASAQANTVGRFLNPMEGHSFGLLFYIPVLLLGFFPWSGWLLFAWYDAFNNWRKTRGQESDLPTDVPSLEWFTAAWIFGTFIFFTLSSTRLPHYIGPLFPAAAILTALFWSRCMAEPATRGARASVHVVMWLGFLLAGAFASLPWIYDTKIAGKLVKEFPLATQLSMGSGPYIAATLLLIGMGLVGAFGLSETRRRGAFWAAAGSLAGVVLVVMLFILPAVNRYFVAPPQELAYAAGVNLEPGEQLIVYASTRPSMAFYARRKVLFVGKGEEDKMREALSQAGRTMILLPETFVEKLPGDVKNYQPILKRYGYLLLASQPMVQIPESAALPPPPSTTKEPLIFGH
ncbi:MAG: glycosyltransferase family 39 protein [Nitrospira sp.]|jgi:4-amino-4-deoxy-L-arabinose transferase-like glycosyltransferase|nr:glycosyltransferase family 39 protein [Nitrospira sp.]